MSELGAALARIEIARRCLNAVSESLQPCAAVGEVTAARLWLDHANRYLTIAAGAIERTLDKEKARP